MSRIRFGAATFAITAVLAGAPLAMAAGAVRGAVLRAAEVQEAEAEAPACLW